MSKVITISREFGSGGKEIGFRLSQALNIPIYDKEIISLASEDSDIIESAFLEHDEILAKTYHAEHSFSELYQVPVSDQIFVAQSQIIRKLESQGPCVLIGRCADMIVEDGFHVFICSNMKNRIARMKTIEPELEEKELESKIRHIDRKRKEYYQYYSGNEWGNPRNHHLSLHSGKLGIETCVEIILNSLEY